MPCSGTFSAVGGFCFFGLAKAIKPKYGGNFSLVGGFSFLSGDDFGGGGKTKRWR